MSLKQQLTDDMKAAMKAGEKDRLATIRLINAALKQKEVDERNTRWSTWVFNVPGSNGANLRKRRTDRLKQDAPTEGALEDDATQDWFDLSLGAIVDGQRVDLARVPREVAIIKLLLRLRSLKHAAIDEHARPRALQQETRSRDRACGAVKAKTNGHAAP